MWWTISYLAAAAAVVLLVCRRESLISRQTRFAPLQKKNAAAVAGAVAPVRRSAAVEEVCWNHLYHRLLLVLTDVHAQKGQQRPEDDHNLVDVRWMLLLVVPLQGY